MILQGIAPLGRSGAFSGGNEGADRAVIQWDCRGVQQPDNAGADRGRGWRSISTLSHPGVGLWVSTPRNSEVVAKESCHMYRFSYLTQLYHKIKRVSYYYCFQSHGYGQRLTDDLLNMFTPDS